MGVSYRWADHRQIILNIQAQQPWTWAEYIAVVNEVMPMLRGLDYPCATVVDTSQMGQLPKDGNIMEILFFIEKAMPENVFASVIVAAPYGMSLFMNMLMKLRPRAKRLALFTPTMEEAYTKIYARYREQYPDLAKNL